MKLSVIVLKIFKDEYAKMRITVDSWMAASTRPLPTSYASDSDCFPFNILWSLASCLKFKFTLRFWKTTYFMDIIIFPSLNSFSILYNFSSFTLSFILENISVFCCITSHLQLNLKLLKYKINISQYIYFAYGYLSYDVVKNRWVNLNSNRNETKWEITRWSQLFYDIIA